MPNAFQRARTTRIVQSRHNARVKELRAAFSSPARGERGLIAIEGDLLLGEALRSGLKLDTVFVRSGSESALDRLGEPGCEEILELPPEVFASAVETESPQGIAALLEPPRFQVTNLLPRDRPALVLVAAGLQDPGNLGTLVRSAEAFGATGMVTLPGTVNLWNAKAVRASAGSAFRLPVVSLAVSAMIDLLRDRGVTLLAAVVDGDTSLTDANLAGPSALLIGNEGAGLSPELVAAANVRVSIPCPGPVESLNAAVAGSVLLYEASRQRAVSPATSRKIPAGSSGSRCAP
jgi:TrmH family RNA methyltransferase